MEIYQYIMKTVFFRIIITYRIRRKPVMTLVFFNLRSAEIVFRLIYFKSNEVDKIELFPTFCQGCPLQYIDIFLNFAGFNCPKEVLFY